MTAKEIKLTKRKALELTENKSGNVSSETSLKNTSTALFFRLFLRLFIIARERADKNFRFRSLTSDWKQPKMLIFR